MFTRKLVMMGRGGGSDNPLYCLLV
jgi:hypothetical protein